MFNLPCWLREIKSNLSVRRVLGLSLLAIGAFWGISLYSKLLHPYWTPSDMRELLIYVVVEGVLSIGIIGLLLWLGNENPQSIGLQNPGLKRQIRNGIIAGAIIFVASNFLLTPILTAFIHETGAVSGVKHLFKNPYQLPLWLFCGIFGGGVIEELQRAFVLTRFEKWLGTWGIGLALFLDSFFFGLGHLNQGVAGAVSIAFTGLLYAVVYLRKRSLLEAMIAHGFFDSVGIVLAYILYRS